MITYHIPTENYGFVEMEIPLKLNGQPSMTYEDAKALLIKPTGDETLEGAGIPIKEFNEALDEYLTQNTFKKGTEVWEAMSLAQRSVFQEIKKSLARLKARSGDKDEIHHSLKNK